MAVTQSTACRKGLSNVAQKDATDATYWQFEFGPVVLIFGSGDPEGIVTAAKGSIFIDYGTPAIYQNTAGSTGWLTVTSA